MRKTLLVESIAALRASYESQAEEKRELHLRARDLSSSGDQRAAERVYEVLIQIDANNVEARVELALVHHRLGRFPAALERVLEALGIQPFNARIHHAFGLTLQAVNPASALHRYQSTIGVADYAENLHTLERICRRTV